MHLFACCILCLAHAFVCLLRFALHFVSQWTTCNLVSCVLAYACVHHCLWINVINCEFAWTFAHLLHELCGVKCSCVYTLYSYPLFSLVCTWLSFITFNCLNLGQCLSLHLLINCRIHQLRMCVLCLEWKLDVWPGFHCDIEQIVRDWQCFAFCIRVCLDLRTLRQLSRLAQIICWIYMVFAVAVAQFPLAVSRSCAFGSHAQHRASTADFFSGRYCYMVGFLKGRCAAWKFLWS